MNSYWYAGIAFLTAYVFTLLERLTSEYPKTFRFVIKCFVLHLHSLIYGLIAALAFVLIQELQSNDLLTIKGLGLSNLVWFSFLIGVSAKGFLKIRLFTINDGSSSFPVGIESLVQLFEPWCIETVDLHEFNSVRGYVEKTAALYLKEYEGKHGSDGAFASAKHLIIKNIPRKWDRKKKEAFKIDIDESENIVEAMELFLIEAGKGTFERVFSSTGK